MADLSDLCRTDFTRAGEQKYCGGGMSSQVSGSVLKRRFTSRLLLKNAMTLAEQVSPVCYRDLLTEPTQFVEDGRRAVYAIVAKSLFESTKGCV
jgi:hypothetical protein